MTSLCRIGIAVVLLGLPPLLGCARGPQEGSLHAVLVNGGGRRESNYYSHLDHLRRLLILLESTGVDPERVAVFSGDGADPAADLAFREGQVPPHFWLLPKEVGKWLRPQIDYQNSEIDGFTLQPATREALRTWFEARGKELDRGDTLLFYVTDHGRRNGKDLTENTVTLWGEDLSVGELRELLDLLDPGVRTVLFMSQCYSGGFVHAVLPQDGEDLPDGNACGYFSATADRRAHGCYPEVSRKENVGHSHRMFVALARNGRLPQAQREVLVSDRTPDVPHATSSLFLERRLERTAEQNGRDFDVYVDELLAEAWLDPLEWEAELATLDEVGETFGFASPRFLAELEEQADGLPELNQRLRVYSRRWQAALDDLRRENLRLFQDAHPEWAERLETGTLQKLDAEARSSEAAALLGGLVPFTKEASERYMRLRDLRRKSREAQSAHYRAEVRLAVVLRMRALLTEIAGRFYMARYAPIEERTALAQLQTCEDLEIGGAVDPKLLESFDPLQPFPTLAEERQTLEAIMPGWMGIRYRPAEAADRDQRALPRGAVVVVEVLPDSPAADARLQAADILLGPPEAPFDEPHAVREWIMQNEPGEWVSLRLLRGGDERDVRLRLAAYPLKLPSPAKVGKNGETPPRSEESPPEPAPATETESK